jgi:hypothetical protein
MDDLGMRTELERLVPEPPDVRGWDDVLRRAGRIHRRRRRRLALVAAAAFLLTLAAALGAAGQLSGLLSHSAEAHLLVRGQLRDAGGARVGAIQIELNRAVIAFDRHRRVQLFEARTSSPGEPPFRARWFLERGASGESGLGGALYLRRIRVAVLCSDCRTRDSGRLDLSYAQAAALVDDRLVFALASGETRVATARLVLVRAHLHKGLACRKTGALLHCTRIYTGR